MLPYIIHALSGKASLRRVGGEGAFLFFCPHLIPSTYPMPKRRITEKGEEVGGIFHGVTHFEFPFLKEKCASPKEIKVIAVCIGKSEH